MGLWVRTCSYGAPPCGMGMRAENNACSSGYCLRATMGLGKLEEVFHFIRSQLKRRQEAVMTHVAPPSLVGERLHGDHSGGKVLAC